MNALLLSSLVALAAPLAQEAGQNRPGQAGQAGQTPQAGSLDGNWTIVALEKDGKAVPAGANMTVMVKDNTVTFADRAGGQPSKDMRAMRIMFGQNGTIQVTEAGADGKFEQTSAAPGAAPAAGADAKPADRAPSAGQSAGSKAGVYVLTDAYFAICVHDDAAGQGARPSAQPGAAGANNNSAATAADRAGQPNSKSRCTVVLRREAAARPQ